MQNNISTIRDRDRWLEWHASVGKMIANLNEPTLPAILINAICKLVSVDKSLIAIDIKNKLPVHVFDSGITPDERDVHIERYLSGAYLMDPGYQAIFRGTKPGFYHLEELSPDNFKQSEYYRIYYKKTGVLEDVLYLVKLNERTGLSIVLGRDLGNSPYTKQEKYHLGMVEPIVRNIAQHHWRPIVGKITTTDSSDKIVRRQLEKAFTNFGKSVLTKRETELTHLMLKGHSVKSAAYEMKISPDTVKMHRKNLYAKLRISDHPDLFSLFISTLKHVDQSNDEDPLVSYLNSK